MSTEGLVRWSGLGLAVGGVAIAGFFFALVPGGGFGASPEQLGALYFIGHGLHTVGGVLALLGLVGLYTWLLSRSGWITLVGFLLAFTGTTFFVALGLISELLIPAVPAARRPTEADIFPLIPVTFLPFLIGYVLLGVAVMRSAVFPRAVGPLFIVAGLLLGLPVPWPVPLVGAVAYAAALTWAGVTIWGGAKIAPSPIHA